MTLARLHAGRPGLPARPVRLRRAGYYDVRPGVARWTSAATTRSTARPATTRLPRRRQRRRLRRRPGRRHHRRLGQRLDLRRHRPGRRHRRRRPHLHQPQHRRQHRPVQRAAVRASTSCWRPTRTRGTRSHPRQRASTSSSTPRARCRRRPSTSTGALKKIGRHHAVQPDAQRAGRRRPAVRRQHRRRRDLRRPGRRLPARRLGRRRDRRRRGAARVVHPALRRQRAPCIGLVRTDFTRPWNPGDILHFGADTNPWHVEQPRRRAGSASSSSTTSTTRAGRSCSTPTAPCGRPATATGCNCVLPQPAVRRGPAGHGAVAFAPNGTPIAFADANNDGADVIFGDLGNDWIVGGTGRDNIYGGWGNDLLNADDVLTIAGHGDFGDGTRRRSSRARTTRPTRTRSYEDRVYGGAGLDVLIGNTGGDRLIDWVGEFNSYIVPFAPFGIATVSRQVPPQLSEFLYALSRADGADPTRWHRHDRRPGVPAAQRRAARRAGPRHPEGPRAVAGPDRRPDRPAAGQHPRRPARRAALGRLQRRHDEQRSPPDSGAWEVQGGALQRRGRLAGPGRGGGLLRRPVPADLLRDHGLGAGAEADRRLEGERLRDLRLLLADRLQVRRHRRLDQQDRDGPPRPRRAGSSTCSRRCPGGVQADTFYQMLVAVNGTNVTVAGRQPDRVQLHLRRRG